MQTHEAAALHDRPASWWSSWWSRVRTAVGAFAGSSPPRFAISVLVSLALIFTVLLSLPIASATGEITPLKDAFFTAVSVVTVTGLSTVDMAGHWSTFGDLVIYLGVQIGGLGALTLASLLGMIISRRLGLRSRLMAAGDGNPLRAHSGPVSEDQAVGLGEIGNLLRTVGLSTVVIQLVVALVLFPRMLAHGIPLFNSATDSLYYAAMAFTNTGFTPNEQGLAPFATDYVFLAALMVGVVAGAIGFPVIYALWQNLFRRRRRRRVWSVHVKLTVITFGVLTVLGWVVYFLFQLDDPRTFDQHGVGDGIVQALFMSVMTRSGGFATVDVAQLHGASLMVTDMLMFVGGGSASTAGGIKVTTLAVLFLAAVAEARGVNSMEAFHRRIPTDVLRVAVSVVLWGATIVAVATVSILVVTHDSIDRALFDVISAFATCGLSTGLTRDASVPVAGILSMVMLLGRIGSVSLAAALAQRQNGHYYQYPEERPIVG